MTTNVRPHKVTTACLVAGMGSVLVLLSVFASLSTWGSLETRQQVQEAVANAPFDVGDVDTVLGWLRVALMGVAAMAAAGIVLAIFTAQRHRGARVALSVLAGLSALAFLATGAYGILPAAVTAFSIVYLWSKESRAWFAGETGTSSSDPLEPGGTGGVHSRGASGDRAWPATGDDVPRGSEQRSAGPPHQPPASATSGPRPSDRPFGASTEDEPGPHGQRWQPVGPSRPDRYPGSSRRPRSIMVAVVLTSVMAGLVGLVSGANALLYLSSPGDYAQLLVEQPMMQESGLLAQLGMSAEELARYVFIGAAACCVLAALAVGTALLMLRRLPAARIGLTALTGVAIALSVAAFPLGLVWAIGEVFVLVQIYRADANAWFTSR